MKTRRFFLSVLLVLSLMMTVLSGVFAKDQASEALVLRNGEGLKVDGDLVVSDEKQKPLTETPLISPKDPTAIPVLPKDPTAIPVLPKDPTAIPVLPKDPTALPVLPEDPTALPVLPEDPTALPVLPEDSATLPALPEDSTTLPALSENIAEPPVLAPNKTEEPPIPPEAPTYPNGKVSYEVHVKDDGWMPQVKDGEMGGTQGEFKRMEAIKIKSNIEGLGIEYRTHIGNNKWQDWVEGEKMSGIIGEGLQIEAIQMRLTGEKSFEYHLYYQTHVENIGWTKWTKDGAIAGSTGCNYQLEGIRIVIVKEEKEVLGEIGDAYFKKPEVSYAVQGEDYGWQSHVNEWVIAGTIGKSKQLEGLVMKVEGGLYHLGINYRAHVQDSGWQEWISNENISGTVGEAKRLEALQMVLVGEDASRFDLYYQVHVRNFGWLDWGKNGESAGTTGYKYPIEALRVVIRAKDAAAPGSIGTAFREAPLRQSPDYGVETTFIEINIGTQTLTFYKKDAIVVQSPLVTGQENLGYETPRGIFSVLRRGTNVNLAGPGYLSHVDYWMPFIAEEYGMHDASWRDTFGGDIYLYNGSHGCVNMPRGQAELLFYNVTVGTPVVIV